MRHRRPLYRPEPCGDALPDESALAGRKHELGVDYRGDTQIVVGGSGMEGDLEEVLIGVVGD